MSGLRQELRHTAGHLLQTVARRLLATPRGLRLLEGDDLTLIARHYGLDRETDADLRIRAKAAAQRMTGNDAEYRPPGETE